jgi:anti-anti-sigma factor
MKTIIAHALATLAKRMAFPLLRAGSLAFGNYRQIQQYSRMVMQSRSRDWMRENASAATPVSRPNHPNVLPLEGDIDLHVSPVVRESLNVIIKKKPERIVIDLSRVTYIDSAGMAALILAMQEVEAYGGQFFLSGLQETIRSIFETSRLDGVFRILPV